MCRSHHSYDAHDDVDHMYVAMRNLRSASLTPGWTGTTGTRHILCVGDRRCCLLHVGCSCLTCCAAEADEEGRAKKQKRDKKKEKEVKREKKEKKRRPERRESGGSSEEEEEAESEGEQRGGARRGMDNTGAPPTWPSCSLHGVGVGSTLTRVLQTIGKSTRLCELNHSPLCKSA